MDDCLLLSILLDLLILNNVDGYKHSKTWTTIKSDLTPISYSDQISAFAYLFGGCSLVHVLVYIYKTLECRAKPWVTAQVEREAFSKLALKCFWV